MSSICRFMVLPIVFGLLVMMCVPALADDDVNPGGGYSGSGDWTGTTSDDTYTNEAAGVVDAGDIDMSQGGSDTVINYGTVTYDLGSGNGGTIIGSAEGGNRIENYGTVELSIFGSYVNSDDIVNDKNIVINAGDVEFAVFGSFLYGGTNVTAVGNIVTNTKEGYADLGITGAHAGVSNSSYGGNIVTNAGAAYGVVGTESYGDGNIVGNNVIYNSGVAGYVEGDYTEGENTITGWNYIYNSGEVYGYVLGSGNIGDRSTGGNNVIVNTGIVGDYLAGTSNEGANTSGGNNTLTNTGDAYGMIGTVNYEDGTSGGENTLANSGEILEDMRGVNNVGDETSGGSNNVTNSGIVYGIVEGTYSTGDDSTGSGNTLVNSGDVGHAIIGTENYGTRSSGGSNTIENSGTVGGPITGDNDSIDYVGYIYGSANVADDAHGGGNTITNSGSVLSGADNPLGGIEGIIGSYNEDDGTYGGDNTIKNTATGYVEKDLLGSYNELAGNYGSNNSISNAGTVDGKIAGTYNVGTGSHGGGNTITNSGTVGGSIYGSENAGTGSYGGSNTITNSGTVNGSIYGSTGTAGSGNIITNSGTVADNIESGDSDDTVTIQNGSTVGGDVDGQAGEDVLHFENMTDIAGGQYLNFETMALTGSGTNLTGTLNISDTSTINGGLSVNGMLTSPNVIVGAGGTLGGTGTINGTVTANGTIAPGNSIGTLTVNGDVTFAPTSIFSVELAKDGKADLLHSTGSITIQGGTVGVVLESDVYLSGTTWQVLSADGTVDGTFDSVASNLSSPFVSLNFTNNGSTLYLEVERESYASLATTPGQRAIANALDRIMPVASGGMSDLLEAMDFEYGVAEIQQVYENLAPELYFGFKDAALQTSSMFADMQGERAAFLRGLKRQGSADSQARLQGLNAGGTFGADRTWAVWSRGLGSWASRSDHDGYMGFDADTHGVMFGVDGEFTSWLSGGLNFAYTNSDITWSRGSSKGKQYGKQLGAFLSADYAGFYLDGSSNFGWFQNRGTRRIALPDANSQAQSDFDTFTWLGRLNLGYDLELGDFAFGPLASLSHIELRQDDFTETGAGYLNLRMDDISVQRTSSLIGGRFAHTLRFGEVQLTSRLMVGWQHQLDQDRADITAFFQDYPDAPIMMSELTPQTDSLALSAGLTLLAGKYFTSSCDYSLSHGERDTVHSIGLSLGVKF